ncbi:hypothetical protein OG552_10505 [Streptomyces sp. NBC_01476]|uniref:hypothetical protein n=1 Tax=Streptomyces sp. NBC_01476 TaxID=2903881 RepID=UPI002E336584|nr:hypothetical protein [Streptomyces sp. NBC_01476]
MAGRVLRAEQEPHRPGKRLIADARLRGELELCDRWGIPHSQFLGIGDGTWTQRDRAKALAYREYLTGVCPHCGTRPEEWEGDDEAYVAETSLCLGCEAIGYAQADIPQTKHGAKVGLLPWAVHAARQAERELKRADRRPRPWDNARLD